MPRWIKVIVAAALMAALAFTMDWDELRAHAADVDWLIAAVALLAILLEMPVNAMKWYWSLRLHDRPFPWNYLFRVGCMSYFFNNFMPSAIGGDVYRVYRTWPADGDKASSVSAVLVERLVGVGILLINGFVGALFLLEHAIARTFVIVALGAAGLGLVCLPLLVRLQRNGVLSRRFRKIAGVEAMLGRLLKLRSEWLWLLFASLMFQTLAAGVVYLCFAAIGSSIDVPTALLITAAAGLASVLPISISGLGVVEGSIAGTAVALGGDFEAAVLAALLLRFLALAVSGLCGLFCFVDDGVRIQPDNPSADIRLQAKPTVVANRTTT
jgi:glycosyltransferase 2 family protein